MADADDMTKLYFRIYYERKARRLAARDEAIERAWQRHKPPYAGIGDRADFWRRMTK